jgi:hypothetical protein
MSKGGVRKIYYIHLGMTVYLDEHFKYHKMNGPAVIYDDVSLVKWFYHGTQVECQSQEGFERALKLKAFW